MTGLDFWFLASDFSLPIRPLFPVLLRGQELATESAGFLDSGFWVLAFDFRPLYPVFCMLSPIWPPGLGWQDSSRSYSAEVSRYLGSLVAR